MKDRFVKNTTMDSKEHVVPVCDTLSTAAPKAQWNLQMCTPTLKQETVKCIDEEEPRCIDNMYQPQPLESPGYVNFYDSKDYVSELKKEFPEDEYPQLNSSINSKMLTENMELTKLTNKQTVRKENTEVGSSLNIKEENEDNKYQLPMKMERLENQNILDNSGVASVHYDVLVTPRQVQCKLCCRTFKNSFNFLKHNNEHIKLEINRPGINETNVLHQCEYCDKNFDSHNYMLVHISNLHSEVNPKCELCGNQFKNLWNLKRHVRLLHKLHKSANGVSQNSVKCKHCNVDSKNKYRLNKHMKLCHAGKEDKQIIHKCVACKGIYKSKESLTKHMKRSHYDYGRTFDCWCGKQFHTPIHLREHKNFQHSTNRKDEVYKCKHCKAVYNAKRNLTQHVKKVHYDYGRTFDCWCGKQLRTPIHLSEHKRLKHNNNRKNEVYKCKLCKAVFNVKKGKTQHMKRVHYDYGRTFDCWCGKQFRTPFNLRKHMKKQHEDKMKDRNEDKFILTIGKKISKPDTI